MDSTPTPTQAKTATKYKKIFVGGYDFRVKKKELEKYFLQFGAIDHIKTKFDKKGKMPGYSLICFEEVEAAERVLEQRVHLFKGRVIDCRPVLSGKALKQMLESMDNRRVFLSNIPVDFNEEELRKKLEKYAKIQNVYTIKKAGKGTKIGYATIEEGENRESLLKAKIKLRGLRLYMKAYKRKEELQKSEKPGEKIELKGRVERRGQGGQEPGNKKNLDVGPFGKYDICPEFQSEHAYFEPDHRSAGGLNPYQRSRVKERQIAVRRQAGGFRYNSRLEFLRKNRPVPPRWLRIDHSKKPTQKEYFAVREQEPYFRDHFDRVFGNANICYKNFNME